MPGGPLGDFGVVTLAVFHDRGQQQQVAARFEFGLQAPGELIAGLGFDRALAVRTTLDTESGVEQAQKMVNLGHSGDGAFAATARRALFNAHRGRQPLDQIDVGPRELIDELPRVSVHRIEETPLAFGEEQIEGERALARTAHAGDDDELVAGNGERKILQIMLARSVDGDDFRIVRFAASVHAQILRKVSRKARPVWLVAPAATCSGVPCATSRPPSSPPSGPRSMSQSAARMTSRLCSMTSSECPASTRRWKTFRSTRTSSKCRPVVGSSNRKKVGLESAASAWANSARWPASFNLWLSPPERVLSGWPSRTYPRPTSRRRFKLRNARRPGGVWPKGRRNRMASSTVASSRSAMLHSLFRF